MVGMYILTDDLFKAVLHVHIHIGQVYTSPQVLHYYHNAGGISWEWVGEGGTPSFINFYHINDRKDSIKSAYLLR